jgi:FtsH-binding integral membrane protein
MVEPTNTLMTAATMMTNAPANSHLLIPLKSRLITLAIAVFSAFLLYDLKQVMDGGETNYISATLAIYLDLFNIFQSMLALLGIFGGDRE